MNQTLKKINIIRNKTKRRQDKILRNIAELSNEQKEVICKKSANMFTSFEQKIDDVFKKNNMNVLSATYNLGNEVVKDIKKAVSPSNIIPQNDFFSYVNERWLKNIDKDSYPEHMSIINDFKIVQDKVYNQLIQIIETYIKNNNDKLSKCLKNAYESFKIFNTTQQTRCLAKVFVEYIDEQMALPNNLWGMLAYFNKNEIISWAAPFVWMINPHDKNPKIYKCYLEQPQVSLIDINIYFDDATDNEEDKQYKNKYRKIYFQYLNDVFKIAFGENHGYHVKDIYECEIDMLNAMSCNLINNEDENGYNLVSKKEALELFGFDWEEFCKELGFKQVPDDFVCSNINYLLCGTKLLKENWNSPKWRTYWIYIYIRQQTRWDENGWKEYFDFHGKFLRGHEKPIQPNIRPIFGMSFTFNTFLTNEYILHYKNEQLVEYVKSMTQDLIIVFKRIISRNNWMQPKTKRVAIEKLETMKLVVGSPEVLRKDPLLDYKADDPWGNLVKMACWRHEKALELVGKSVIDIPVIDWAEIPPKFISTQAYQVNAMYTAFENSIYIPLGYIQKPFVDLDERGIEYNLAYIGFTIAHEMSHALDDYGSKYDKDGILNDWWTKKDKEEFKKIQENIVKQYEEFGAQDGIIFDAWPTIGEDLADISGFAICQEYLRDFQLKNEDILPIQSLSFTSFFVYFALQSRQKISKKAILAQLKTNPHPLDKYRCNIPLSRSKIFRAIYDIQKGDKMWWSSLNNVWSN